MPTDSTSRAPHFKLSICISTRNRAAFIGATLESIIVQATNECEIVVFDGASTDDTEKVVSGYAQRFAQLRYFRQDTNDGVDRGFDHAVQLASGEYCWLLPDDDFVKPGAVAAVLEAIHHDYSLVIVNVEYRTFDLSTVLKIRELDINIDSDREFGPADLDGLFESCWRLVRYIGATVIKRSLWLARAKDRYYGSLWLATGVIFQERLPGFALVIARPHISVRMENQSWLSHLFRVFFISWPSLAPSLALSESVKNQVYTDEPWMNIPMLLLCRGAGQYSLAEYKAHIRPRLRNTISGFVPALIALIPSVMLNMYFLLYYSTLGRRNGRALRMMMAQSPANLRRRWRALMDLG